MVAKIEQRFDKSAEIQEETMKFTRKALKDLNGFKNVSHQLMSQGQGRSEEVLMFNGLNIAALGGASPAGITKNIAESLFTPAELGNLVIDPQKT